MLACTIGETGAVIGGAGMTFDVAKLAGAGIGAGRDGLTCTGGGTESAGRGSTFSIFAIDRYGTQAMFRKKSEKRIRKKIVFGGSNI